MPTITTLRGIEQGRADYAYKCAQEALATQNAAPIADFDNEYFRSDNYKSYVKKIPMLVKTNGLGATFSFVLSKKAKEKKEQGQTILPGDRRNPKNAYDLIYQQTLVWINSKFPFTGEFSQFLITRTSSEYRAIANEIIALFTWQRRFAEGLIISEEEQS